MHVGPLPANYEANTYPACVGGATPVTGRVPAGPLPTIMSAYAPTLTDVIPPSLRRTFAPNESINKEE
jgi:hypothetical protein